MADTDGVDAILEQWQRERPDLDASPIGEAAVKHLANEQRILSGLTETEQRQLAGLLRKLRIWRDIGDPAGTTRALLPIDVASW